MIPTSNLLSNNEGLEMTLQKQKNEKCLIVTYYSGIFFIVEFSDIIKAVRPLS